MARSRSASDERSDPTALGGVAFANRRIGCVRRLEPAAETLQVGVHGLAVRADCAFERRRGNRQPPAAGDEPEHDRVDHGAALLGQRFHVEEETGLRMLLDRLDEPCAVVAPVGHRHSLDHQIGTGGRCDHQRAVRRDETAGDGAARFHELARQHDIDVANAGRQRQHRPRGKLPRRHRNDLDVIGRGAGALSNAGNRRRLHGEAELRGGGDDPVREHAAALAAERGDEDGDRPGLRTVHRDRSVRSRNAHLMPAPRRVRLPTSRSPSGGRDEGCDPTRSDCG